jgi:hypothetical protein
MQLGKKKKEDIWAKCPYLFENKGVSSFQDEMFIEEENVISQPKYFRLEYYKDQIYI